MPSQTGPYIRNRHVILHDVSGIECAFSAEYLLSLQMWLFDHHLDLLALHHRPKGHMFHDRNCCTEEKGREQLL